MPARIVVFTGDLSHAVRKGIAVIDDHIPDLEWLILVHAPRKPLGKLLRSQVINLRRNGWRWIPHQFADLTGRVRQRFIPSVDTSPGPFALSRLRAERNIEVVQVNDIHGDESISRVDQFAPDLGLSLAAPILRRSLFGVPRLGTLNLHKGKVPDYRGMPPAFWELTNDETAVGCTVHQVDDKLDTGAIALEDIVPRDEFSTLRGLQLTLDECGIRLMRDAVAQTLDGTLQPRVQPPGGKTYRKPTLKQFATMARSMRKVDPVTTSPLRQTVKDALARSAFLAWRLGGRRLLAPRITVLLYHRVSDAARDNLTVGIEQFDRHMGLIAKYCKVLSIEDVLAVETIPASDRPLVCVTFDDGYKDNHDHAAPILQRHNLPAAFYVTTGLIGTEARFPHDVRRENEFIPLMDWNEVAAMHRAGFSIGSHSVHHIDCAAESEETVVQELDTSRDALRARLGLHELIFAYPYGGRQHMTPARLELVRNAGYAGCLAAYGGTNVGSVDRFEVRRRGIHWEYSDAAFLFECLGLR